MSQTVRQIFCSKARGEGEVRPARLLHCRGMTNPSQPASSEGPSGNQAPNPPSAAEPQPKPGAPDNAAAPRPPKPQKGAAEPQVAPEPGGDTPVNPDQSDG